MRRRRGVSTAPTSVRATRTATVEAASTTSPVPMKAMRLSSAVMACVKVAMVWLTRWTKDVSSSCSRPAGSLCWTDQLASRYAWDRRLSLLAGDIGRQSRGGPHADDVETQANDEHDEAEHQGRADADGPPENGTNGGFASHQRHGDARDDDEEERFEQRADEGDRGE